MSEMPSWLSDAFGRVVQAAGPVVIILGVLLWVYYNPSASAEVQRTTLERLAKVEEQADLLRETNVELERRVNKLKSQILTLQSVQDSLPWPAWIKDLDGEVISANRAYEQAFLTPRGYTLFDYVGASDYDVWPEDIADEFRRNDLEIQRTRRTTVFTEEVEILPGERVRLKFVKYPRYIGNKVVGVAGMSVPE